MSNKFIIRNLLQDTISMTLSVETVDGNLYRGRIREIDDYMNVIMEEVEMETNNGNLKLKEVFIRGSSIRFIQLPNILQYSTLLNKKDN